MKKIIVLILMMVSVLNMSCQDATETDENKGEIEIVDIEGRTVYFDEPVQRIVDCTGLGGTRLLIQLESEQLVVGMADQARNSLTGTGASRVAFHPASKADNNMTASEIQSIGAYNEPNLQEIIALEPDVVLIGWGGKKLAESVSKQTGIKTVCIGRMDGRFDYDLLTIMGKLVGKEERAEALIEYTKNKLKIITDVTATMKEEDKKSVYLWIYPKIGVPPRAIGTYDALDYAGVINVALEENSQLFETTREQIASWNPDYVFLQSFNKEMMDQFHSKSSLKEDEILGNIDAFAEGHVANIKGPNSDWDIAVELTEVFYIAKILYPELFKDLDVEAHGNEIMYTFYDVENLYTEMREFLEMESFD